MRKANRLAAVPPYIFAEIDRTKRELRRRGADLIDLGIGDPDKPSPKNVVNALIEQVQIPSNHRYPSYDGSEEFREAICAYYKSRFGVALDADKESIALIGSKEGLSHLIWAFADPGDVVLVPDPAYPVYKAQTLLAGGIPYEMPLVEQNGFVPDLDAIPSDVRDRAKLMFLNYPNNPTAGVASLEFFRKAVEFAKRYDIAICHDAAYIEMTYDGYRAPSILEVDGAKEIAVEMYSWSKPFNMTGWRIGAMVGNPEMVAALKVIKTNTDSGQFTAVQLAATRALAERPEQFISEMNRLYQARRDVMMAGLSRIGLHALVPKGSFYIWCKVPDGHTSKSFTEVLLNKAHVVVVPGGAYGPTGEGYIRIALTVETAKLEEACNRMAKVLA